MRFRGREIDPVALWAEYVDFPPNLDAREQYLGNFRCPNPDHDTLKSHFQINIVDGLVHCFANCGISGTFEHAIMMIEGCDRETARKKILGHRISRLDRATTAVRRGRGKASNTASGSDVPISPDLSGYSYLPPVATDYLEKRGITGESVAKWELGWNPDTKRLTIPARDENGHLKFVIERAVLPQTHPKYLYPDGIRRNDLLFGARQIDPGMIRSMGLILVEGSTDVIMLHQLGYSNVAGILGSYVSKRQAEIVSKLRPKKIYTFFDFDAAGAAATLSAKKKIRGIPIYVCRYPSSVRRAGHTDPGEITREEADTILRRAVPYLKFQSNLQGVQVG